MSGVTASGPGVFSAEGNAPPRANGAQGQGPGPFAPDQDLAAMFPPSDAEADDLTPHATYAPQHFNETSGASGKAGEAGRGSLKVGWTLRKVSDGTVVKGFAFNINPQAITRAQGTRAQVFATQGGFYVDDFGPAPTNITVRQLVASGHWENTPNFGLTEVYSLREDVQRFLKTIWVPATKPNAADHYRVFFHDNHLSRGHDEEVYFPPQGLSIQRAVDLQGVWLLELQMVGLEVFPLSDVTVQTQFPDLKHAKRYIVKRGDTLRRLVMRLAGKNPTRKRERQVLAKILKLNPQLAHKRTLTPGSTGYVGSTTVTVLPHRLAPGEVLILPA